MQNSRLDRADWKVAAESLTARGFAPLPRLLFEEECASLIGAYEESDRFRSRIDMAQYRFGRGEYQYFGYPLPPVVKELREGLYTRLAPVANQWAELIGGRTLIKQ